MYQLCFGPPCHSLSAWALWPLSAVHIGSIITAIPDTRNLNVPSLLRVCHNHSGWQQHASDAVTGRVPLRGLVIWNPVPLDRIGQNGTYQYVPVHGGTTWYRSVSEFLIRTRQYVPVHTSTGISKNALIHNHFCGEKYFRSMDQSISKNALFHNHFCGEKYFRSMDQSRKTSLIHNHFCGENYFRSMDQSISKLELP